MTCLRFFLRATLALQLSLLSACGEDNTSPPIIEAGLDLRASAALDADVLAAEVPASIDGPTLAADLPADAPLASADASLANEAGVASETGASDLSSPSDCLHIEGGPDLGMATPGTIGVEVIFKVWSSCGALDTGPMTASIDHPHVTISSNTCATAVRPTLASPCTVGLRLVPPANASPSAVTAVLTVHSGVGSASATVTGLVRIICDPFPNPSSINFGTLQVGQSSIRTVTFQNYSNQASPPLSASLNGSGAAQLTILDGSTCKGALPPATSCQVVVQYLPTDLSGVSAMLVLTDGTDCTAGVPVVGSAVPAVTPSTVYQATPSSVDFGSVPIGQSSTSTTTLTNTSATTSHPFGVYLNGSGAAQVSIVGITSCGPLSPGASCRITVQFVPKDTSGVDALIIVSDGSISIGIPMVGAGILSPTLDGSVESGQNLSGG